MDAGHSLSDYGALLRRRWVYLITIIPSTLLLSVFIAYILPVTYRASGTIMLEPSSIPTEMVQSTVRGIEDIPAYAQQELELMRRRVMTPDRLLELIKAVDPYPRLAATPEVKALMVADNVSVERVDPITLKPLDQSTAFSIYYDNPNPKIAAAVASHLIEMYLTYNRRTRTEQAGAAYDFLQGQARELEGSMTATEQRLAKFKAEYGGALPEMQSHNITEVDRAQRDLEAIQQQELLAEEKESQLQLQLNNLSPSLTAAVSDVRTELAKLRAQLADAEQRYTPEHPEVKRLRRAIAEMGAQNEASSRVAAGLPDNPEYLAVRSQLEAARRSMRTLQASESRARREISTYEGHLATAPNVEREYRQLEREYENERTRYEDVQGKMKNAALARTMENQDRGEKFSLMRAPVTPRNPYFPNRAGIVLLGLVLGSALAFGYAALRDAMDPTVRSSSDLQGIMETTAIGTVPVIVNPSERRSRRLRWGSAALVYALAAVCVAMTVWIRR